MKQSSNFRRFTLTASLIVAASLVAAPASLFAQEKGGVRLLGGGADKVSVTQTETAMNCPKCKDSVKTGAAAVKRQGQLTASHDCNSCATKVTTSGVGKQAVDQVTHNCAMASSRQASCCSGGESTTHEMPQASSMQHCPMMQGN